MAILDEIIEFTLRIFIENFYKTICYLIGKIFISIVTLNQYPTKDQQQKNEFYISLLGLVILLFLIAILIFYFKTENIK